MKNILAVVAHPDDFEMMAGGSVFKWLAEGKSVHVLALTNGSWRGPDGNLCRKTTDINKEIESVKTAAGYHSYEVLTEETLNLQFKDSLVCEVLKRIQLFSIDTIITSWDKDTHHDHRIACEIAKAASRRVPNFLMGQINYYLLDSFDPNLYVDITDTFDKKLELMSLYNSQWDRSKSDWTDFLNASSVYLGKVIGVEKAEGFIAKKLKI